MAAISSRVETIEKKLGLRGGQLVIAFVGPDEAKIDALFAAHGLIRNDPANEVVIFQTLYEREGGGHDPVEPDSYGLKVYPRS